MSYANDNKSSMEVKLINALCDLPIVTSEPPSVKAKDSLIDQWWEGQTDYIMISSPLRNGAISIHRLSETKFYVLDGDNSMDSVDINDLLKFLNGSKISVISRTANHVGSAIFQTLGNPQVFQWNDQLKNMLCSKK